MENRVKNLDEEGYSSLGKMLQGPVRNTVRARGRADLETHDGFVNLLRVGYIGVQQGGHQPHVPSKCRDQRNHYQLKLSLQTVSQVFGLLCARESNTPRGEQGGRWSRDSHHPFGYPPQGLVFGIKGFKCRTPLVVPPLIQLVGHRSLQAG